MDEEKPAPSAVSIDGYEDLELIGEGGFSRVYSAQQVGFGRRVAIKVLNVDRAGFDTAAFLAECENMGTVSDHPNIVPILSNGFTEGGQPYLTMELMSETLLERIRTVGVLSPEEAIDLGERLALALERAHGDGVIHCDIKPHNIFYTKYGELALGDFGIASVVQDGDPEATARGFTPNYAAPELLDGGSPSAASDLYALGATLYTAVAGHHPYRSATEQSEDLPGERAEAAIQAGATPDEITIQEIPEDLERMIFDLLSPEPADRPQSASGLAVQFAAMAGDDQTLVAGLRESRPLADIAPDDAPTIVRRGVAAADSTGGIGLGAIIAMAAAVAVVIGGVMLLVRQRSGPDEVVSTTAASSVGVAASDDAAVAEVDKPETTTASTTTTTTTTTVPIAPELAGLVAGEAVQGLGCTYNQTFETGLVGFVDPTFADPTVTLAGPNVANAAHVELRVREVDLNVYWTDAGWERTAQSIYVPLNDAGAWDYDVDLPDGNYCVIARGRDRGNGGTDRGATIAFTIVGSAATMTEPGDAAVSTANLLASPPNGSYLYVDSPIRVKLREETASFEVLRDGTPVELPAEQQELLMANERVELQLVPGEYVFDARGADNTQDIHSITILPPPGT